MGGVGWMGMAAAVVIERTATLLAEPRYWLGCLGDFTLKDTGERPVEAPRGRKARALVAVLSRAPEHGETRDRLTGLLWSERGEAQARASLRQTLFELRGFTHGSPPLIVAERDRVRLSAGAYRCDVEAVIAAAGADDPKTVAGLLADWRGEFLRDLDGVDPALDDWLPGERERGLRLVMDAAVAAAGRWLGRDAAAARALVAKLEPVDPFNEALVRLAMRADAAQGDLGTVSRRYERLAERLRAEFGVAPSPETRRVLDELRAAAPAGVIEVTAAPSPSPVTAAPPLVILRPLATMGGGANAQLIAQGATDDLQVELARYRDLRVMFMDGADEERMAAAARGAISAYVLEGTVREQGGRAKVNLKLRSLAGVVAWAEQLTLVLDDYAAGIDEIVRKVAGATGPIVEHGLVGQPQPPAGASTLLVYFRARALARQARTGEQARAAAAMLEEVIEAQPTLVGAHLHLARLYNTDYLMTLAGHDPAPLRARAMELTLRAVEMDPLDPHAQQRLGWCYLRRAQWAEAERCFATALTLNPFHADEINAVGVGTCVLGELDEAERLMQLALALNPFPHFEYRNDLAVLRLFERRHAEAERYFSESSTIPLGYAALRLANFALLHTGGARVGEMAATVRARLGEIWQAGAPMTAEAIEDWLWSQWPLRREAERALVADGLARAGLIRA